MDENQRLQLQKMISVNNVEDQTGLIRELKHSHILRDDINNLISESNNILQEPNESVDLEKSQKKLEELKKRDPFVYKSF